MPAFHQSYTTESRLCCAGVCCLTYRNNKLHGRCSGPPKCNSRMEREHASPYFRLAKLSQRMGNCSSWFSLRRRRYRVRASLTAELRVEFDQLKEISLIPVEGLLLGESLETLYEANQDIAARTVPASRLSTCRPSMRVPCPEDLSSVWQIRNRLRRTSKPNSTAHSEPPAIGSMNEIEFLNGYNASALTTPGTV